MIEDTEKYYNGTIKRTKRNTGKTTLAYLRGEMDFNDKKPDNRLMNIDRLLRSIKKWIRKNIIKWTKT